MILFNNILEFLSLGGPVVIILLMLSCVALTIMILKTAQFMRCKIGSSKDIDEALLRWFNGDFEGAIVELTNKKSAASIIVKEAMQKKYNKSGSRAEIEASLMSTAKSEFHNLQRGFKTLDAMAQVAPLIGLFGTVIGMIEAFQTLQNAGRAVDPSQLAGGIWVALLTTAVGLAVAIPVSLFVTWLETKVESERIIIEVSTEAILKQRKPPAKASKDVQ